MRKKTNKTLCFTKEENVYKVLDTKNFVAILFFIKTTGFCRLLKNNNVYRCVFIFMFRPGFMAINKETDVAFILKKLLRLFSSFSILHSIC